MSRDPCRGPCLGLCRPPTTSNNVVAVLRHEFVMFWPPPVDALALVFFCSSSGTSSIPSLNFLNSTERRRMLKLSRSYRYQRECLGTSKIFENEAMLPALIEDERQTKPFYLMGPRATPAVTSNLHVAGRDATVVHRGVFARSQTEVDVFVAAPQSRQIKLLKSRLNLARRPLGRRYSRVSQIGHIWRRSIPRH